MTAYADVSHAAPIFIADFESAIQFPPDLRDEEYIVTATPTEYVALLEQDNRALQVATARVDVSGSDDAQSEATVLSDIAEEVIDHVKLYLGLRQPEPDEDPTTPHVIFLKHQTIYRSYQGFLKVAKHDIRE